jgi:hypothetical protein
VLLLQAKANAARL